MAIIQSVYSLITKVKVKMCYFQFLKFLRPSLNSSTLWNHKWILIFQTNQIKLELFTQNSKYLDTHIYTCTKEVEITWWKHDVFRDFKILFYYWKFWATQPGHNKCYCHLIPASLSGHVSIFLNLKILKLAGQKRVFKKYVHFKTDWWIILKVQGVPKNVPLQ